MDQDFLEIQEERDNETNKLTKNRKDKKWQKNYS